VPRIPPSDRFVCSCPARPACFSSRTFGPGNSDVIDLIAHVDICAPIMTVSIVHCPGGELQTRYYHRASFGTLGTLYVMTVHAGCICTVEVCVSCRVVGSFAGLLAGGGRAGSLQLLLQEDRDYYNYHDPRRLHLPGCGDDSNNPGARLVATSLLLPAQAISIVILRTSIKPLPFPCPVHQQIIPPSGCP
jgi:hypothetical protein